MWKLTISPNMTIFFIIPFYTLKDLKMQKCLHFRKVHARSYKKLIYGFPISPIVQKIFAIKAKNIDCQSPLSGLFMFWKDFKKFEKKSIFEILICGSPHYEYWNFNFPAKYRPYDIGGIFKHLSTLSKPKWPSP